MQLESLPNEILLNLFEFFNTPHLLRAFFGLNNRFNHLIYFHLRNYQFSFQSISKTNFDIICHQHLPSLINRILKFNLSNEETPNLSELILSQGFTLNRFIHLQSLSLNYIHSLELLIKITSQCVSLSHLTHLSLIRCNIEERKKEIIVLFNNIWKIPKLTHCHLNGIQIKFSPLSQISTISLSIEYIIIENIPCDLNCLSRLFQYTPNLKRLATTVYAYSNIENLNFVNLSLTSLRIFFQGSIDSLKIIFSNLPNLLELIIETVDIYLDGDAWKEIIRNYLPKIKLFQFKMKFEISGNENEVEEKINELLDTFRTVFWIEEHQWYIRCHWESSEISTCIILYTIPFAFKSIHYLNECNTKSTCINDEESWSCKSVQYFENNYRKSFMFHNFNLICNQFPNLRFLHIILPFSDDIYLHNVTLNQLISLNVTILKISAYSQLQALFDRAPCLYSLRLISAQRLSPELFRLTSQSIRRIDLIGKQFGWRNQFSREACTAFISSPLGCQCEVLSIEVENRISIIELIQRMSNLRLLNIRCKDDRWDHRKILSTEYELVHWIQNQFPSTYLIMRDPEKSSCIQVWIDQEEKLLEHHPSLTKSRHKVSQLLTSIQRLFTKK